MDGKDLGNSTLRPRSQVKSSAKFIPCDGSVIITLVASNTFVWSEGSQFTRLSECIGSTRDFSSDGKVLAGAVKSRIGWGAGYLYHLGETALEVTTPNNALWSMSSNARYYSKLSSPNTL